MHEGLLSHEPHRGVFIPEVSRSDVEDLFLLRMALEVEAARTVASRKLSVPVAVAAVERMESFHGDEPWAEVTEVDLSFHRALIGALNGRRMNRVFDSLLSELRLIVSRRVPLVGPPCPVSAL